MSDLIIVRFLRSCKHALKEKEITPHIMNKLKSEDIKLLLFFYLRGNVLC